MSGDSRHRAVAATGDTYDLGDAIPFESVRTVPEGTSLLVRGPAMTGKRDLAAAIIDRGLERGESAIVVTADDPATKLRSRFAHVDDGDRLRVVDCSGTSGKGTFDDTDAVKHVSTPGDLTGIGIGIAKCTQAIGRDAEAGVRTAVLSLSTMLQYTSADKLFSFVHVLTGRTAAAGYLGVATIDPTVHEAETVNAIAAQFDGSIELREGESGREIRVRGLSGAPTGWHEY